MVTAQESLTDLLTRATMNPHLLADLGADPLGKAHRAGVRVTAEDLKYLIGVPGASDLELVEVLLTRLARRSAGCGGCEGPV